MKQLIRFTMALAFATSGFANAGEPTIKELLPPPTHFHSVAHFLEIASLLSLQIKKQGWQAYARKYHVDLTKLNFAGLIASGNELHLPGIAAPFVFLNDHKTIVYKGAKFVFDITKSAEANMVQMKKAWDVFKELKSSEQQTSFINLLVPQAQANLLTIYDDTLMVVTGIMLTTFTVLAFVNLPIEVAGLGLAAILALSVLEFKTTGSVSKKELDCATKKYVIKGTSQVAPKQPIDPKSADAIAQICAAGPATVAAYNKSLDEGETKIAAGDYQTLVPSEITPMPPATGHPPTSTIQ